MNHTYNFPKEATQPKIPAIVLAKISLTLSEIATTPAEAIVAPATTAIASTVAQEIDTCPK